MTVATKLIAGPGHAPLGWLAVWKEGVLGLILVIAVGEIIGRFFKVTSYELRVADIVKRDEYRFDFLDLCIIFLLILSVAVTAFTHANWNLYLFGFRYDFIPLIAFFILRRVIWSEMFLVRARTVILAVGVIVAAYGMLTFILPASFFHALGYSDLHSLYIADKPIAAFQMIGGTDLRRIQGPMSGPNHLGVWLLIPLAVVITYIVKNQEPRTKNSSHFMLSVIACLLFLIALFLSFSRAAWIATFVMFAIALFPLIRTFSRRVLVGLGAAVACVVIVAASLFPSVIVRLSSSRGHLHNPIEALHEMIRFPLGKGMGMAGPASNRVSETCVLLRENDDPTWWTQNQPNMCVFLGNTQVQPVDHVCICPFLPENWYLQIGVEMGWVGFALYLALVAGVLRMMKKLKIAVRGPEVLRPEWENGQLKMPEAIKKMSSLQQFSILNSQFSIRLAFLSVSIAALFLHAWEDSATAYTLWILLASVLPVAQRRLNP